MIKRVLIFVNVLFVENKAPLTLLVFGLMVGKSQIDDVFSKVKISEISFQNKGEEKKRKGGGCHSESSK